MKVIFANDRLDVGTMCATIGLFDGVHLGHLHTLNMVRLQAAACGLKPMVVTFDQHPQHILRPEEDPVPHIMSASDRLSWLDDAGIDTVLVFEFIPELAALTSAEFMQMLHDNYGVARLIVGYNNHFGSDTDSSIDDYKRTGDALGVTVLQATQNPYGPVNSSMIRLMIAGKGYVKLAAMLLGRYFYVRGKVVHGDHMGTSLGFPTANVGERPRYQLMPAPGAYVVTVRICDEDGNNGQLMSGMAGVGHRPTVTDDQGDTTLEVNLFNYAGDDLYGKKITVIFIDRLRDEIKFDNVDDLRDQLVRDRDAAEKILKQHFNKDKN